MHTYDDVYSMISDLVKEKYLQYSEKVFQMYLSNEVQSNLCIFSSENMIRYNVQHRRMPYIKEVLYVPIGIHTIFRNVI